MSDFWRDGALFVAAMVGAVSLASIAYNLEKIAKALDRIANRNP